MSRLLIARSFFTRTVNFSYTSLSRGLTTGTKIFDKKEHAEEDIYIRRAEADLSKTKYLEDSAGLILERKKELIALLGNCRYFQIS